MSHSKRRQQGKSYYLDRVNPKAKKYLTNCTLCGHIGYDPRIDEGYYSEMDRNPHLKEEVTRLYDPLQLNEEGLCENCAASI